MNMRILSVIGVAGMMAVTALPAAAVPKAVTRVLPRESFVGTESHTLPTPPVHPALFSLPIDVQVAKDDNLADNPITSKYGIGSDIKVWAEDIRKCMYARPVLVRVVGRDSVPFVISGDKGLIKMKGNKAVCSIY
ncbi:hypothetical protein OsccyDRAFT_2718 [Leptolyngbyaceae cyanobacterium JSC-12]|nr:hypothetical protein OsccyDRAFT_2718 [Leptolyngbyaceae cyanobacterium JSC-12]